ncbi:MAG: hypothetical protein Q9162_000584 [Coniocarpon cinnabarinum]
MPPLNDKKEITSSANHYLDTLSNAIQNPFYADNESLSRYRTTIKEYMDPSAPTNVQFTRREISWINREAWEAQWIMLGLRGKVIDMKYLLWKEFEKMWAQDDDFVEPGRSGWLSGLWKAEKNLFQEHIRSASSDEQHNMSFFFFNVNESLPLTIQYFRRLRRTIYRNQAAEYESRYNYCEDLSRSLHNPQLSREEREWTTKEIADVRQQGLELDERDRAADYAVRREYRRLGRWWFQTDPEIPWWRQISTLLLAAYWRAAFWWSGDRR